MDKHDAVNNSFMALVDSWQEYKGGDKLNPELCDLIEQHMSYVYVAGFDEIYNEIEKIINAYLSRNQAIPPTFLRTVIRTKYKDDAKH